MRVPKGSIRWSTSVTIDAIVVARGSMSGTTGYVDWREGVVNLA